MRAHRHFHRLIDRRLLGPELTGNEEQKLRRHLAGCVHCRAHYDQKSHHVHLLVGRQDDSPTPAALASQFEGIFHSVQEKKERSRAPIASFWLLRGAVLAASMVAVFLLPTMLQERETPKEYAAIRGGVTELKPASLGISGVDEEGLEYEVVHSAGVCPQDALRLYARVRSEEYENVFVFGFQDGDLEPTWYFPDEDEGISFHVDSAPTEAWMFPYEIPLEDNHHSGQALHVVSVFTQTPLHLDEVLALWNQSPQNDPLPGFIASLSNSNVLVEVSTIQITHEACKGGQP